jgi:phosphoglucomutase
MLSVLAKIDNHDGKLLPSTRENIRAYLSGSDDGVATNAIEELIERNEFGELNDRFYKTLAFGTGGLRGRTIGKIVTRAERGNAPNDFPPQFPCVGTNAMNFFNIARATRGLVAYLREWKDRQSPGSPSPGASRLPLPQRERAGMRVQPKLVIAHDTRFFSRAFAELAAKVASDNGCDAFLFSGPRSTPELSFAVRHLRAEAGVVITASHNPPHDNGYKVYFNDGAQVIEPHASGIIAKVNNGGSSAPSLDVKDHAARPQNSGIARGAADPPGAILSLGEFVDLAYMQRLETLVLNRHVIRGSNLKIVFTPIHGTGGVIVKPLLEKVGFNFEIVPEQDKFDGAFPTVKSPNPENAEALSMAIDRADKTNADLVVATDPDCDRMGVAVRDSLGQMRLLTGNQIGSLMAYYRANRFFERGILNKENASRGVIIKTLVTTDLQKAIAEHFGLRCVETLTGFKYIGEKLTKYEKQIPRDALPKEYVDLSEEETRALRLKYSSFYVFGGEESYGYSGADFVRDKDGNGSVLMFCEIAAYAKSRAKTIDQFLDELYAGFGYFEERSHSLVFEGADGAAKIAQLAESYAKNPPNEMLGTKVEKITNFATETIHDVEGDEIPKEKMSIFKLVDQTRIAVRPSGTEPKIKYYLFAQRRVANGRFSKDQLAQNKREVGEHLSRLWQWLEQDAQARLAR